MIYMCNDILIILYVGLLTINWYQDICCFDVGKVVILLIYFSKPKRMMTIKVSQGSFVFVQKILDLSRLSANTPL